MRISDWSSDVCSSTYHARRFELMKTFRDLLYKHRDRLVEISKHEAGAATGAAYRAQIDGALSGADGLISEFQRMKWQEDRGVKNENGYDNQRYVLREAAGVVGAITPWNVPLYINVGKVVDRKSKRLNSSH